jgi:hypothetical protein
MDKQENKSNDKYCQFTCNIGDVLLSEYRILKELTKGGMNSTIYIAERLPEYVTKSNRNEQIAIKIINRDENIDDND